MGYSCRCGFVLYFLKMACCDEAMRSLGWLGPHWLKFTGSLNVLAAAVSTISCVLAKIASRSSSSSTARNEGLMIFKKSSCVICHKPEALMCCKLFHQCPCRTGYCKRVVPIPDRTALTSTEPTQWRLLPKILGYMVLHRKIGIPLQDFTKLKQNTSQKQMRGGWVRERFEEGRVHALQHTIVKDTWLERLSLEKIEVLCCHFSRTWA